MELKKRFVKKNNREYVDFILEWEHDGRVFQVRVDPVFKQDFKRLLAHASVFGDAH